MALIDAVKRNGRLSRNQESSNQEEEESDDDVIAGVAESDEEESDDDDEDDEISAEQFDKTKYQAVCDFVGEQEGDLQFQTGDYLVIHGMRKDGWWEAEDGNGAKGLVPSTFLKAVSHSDGPPFRHPPSKSIREEASGGGSHDELREGRGHALWKKVRKIVQQPSEQDVLAALGALPPSCTDSRLALRLKNECGRLTLGAALWPRLTESSLHFRHLAWDSNSKQLQPYAVRIQRKVILLACKNMVDLGSSWEICNRYVRTCLYDGHQIVGNVHTVLAGWNPKSPKSWTFAAKASSIRHPEVFLRSSSTSPDIGLLIELCIFCRRVSSGEVGELCCGWVHLPLVDKGTGVPVPSRTYSVDVHFGPLLQNSDSNSPLTSATEKGLNPLKSMIRRQQKSVLTLKLCNVPKSQQAQLDLLPDPLMMCTTWLPLVVFYRRALADAILNYRLSPYDASLLHSPYLSTFPTCANQPDIMDALNVSWSEAQRLERHTKKSATHDLDKSFQRLFLETAYMLCHIGDLPEFNLSDLKGLQNRKEAIERYLHDRRKRGTLDVLLSSKIEYSPFGVSEVAFDMLQSETQ